MKKIICLVLSMVLVGVAFAAPYKISESEKEYKTFNKVNYVTEYVSEFNSWDDFVNKHLPTADWVLKTNQIGLREPNKREFQNCQKKEFGTFDTFKAGTIITDNYKVENGALGLVYKAYREPNGYVNSYQYHIYSAEIDCGEWYKSVGKGRETKDSYFMHIDGKKIFEMKFKVPVSPCGFEVFMISRDGVFDDFTDINKYRTTKNEYIDEIDFLELTTDGIKNPNETPKNYIRPRGGIHATKNGKLLEGYNLIDCYDIAYTWESFDRTTYIKNTEKWCDEWHTLTVELSPTSMTCYMDGKKYKNLKWGKKTGAIPAEQEWEIRIFPESYGCWTSEIDWENGVDATFLIDYIKVFTEVK